MNSISTLIIIAVSTIGVIGIAFVVYRIAKASNLVEVKFNRPESSELLTSRKLLLVLVIISLLGIISSAFLFVQAQSLSNDNTILKAENKKNASKVVSLSTSLSLTKRDYNSIIDELRFYRTTAVIVTENGQKYHRYGCYHLDGSDFWIYNIDAARGYGYEPCQDCMSTCTDDLVYKQ